MESGEVRTGRLGRERTAESQNADGGEPQVTAAGSILQTAWHYVVEGSPGTPGRGLGMGRTPIPSMATSGETWRVSPAVWRSSSSTGRYVFC